MKKCYYKTSDGDMYNICVNTSKINDELMSLTCTTYSVYVCHGLPCAAVNISFSQTIMSSVAAVVF